MMVKDFSIEYDANSIASKHRLAASCRKIENAESIMTKSNLVVGNFGEIGAGSVWATMLGGRENSLAIGLVAQEYRV